ncbi:MAG: sulfatase [Rubripirellula sp.]|nr:sulfatase [Rubripirellula sp.]
MKRSISILFIVVLLSSISSAAKPPNFVLLYVDDLGWAETSVEMIKGRPDTRSDYYQTPNIARIAKAGMVLSSCYSPSALCAPSRNSLLHGMTPSRLRYTVLSAVEAKKKYMGQITIPQALKQANPDYTTAHFGKWHNESIKPTEAGYDVTDGANGNGPGDFDDDRKTHLPDDDPKRIFSLTDNSIQFMKDQVAAEKPFYLQLSHYAMHIWHDSLKETREKYKQLPKGRKYGKKDNSPEEDISIATYNHGWIINYAAMLDDMDRAIGTLLDAIDQLGIAENTYVILTSDNGGGFRGNAPLKGGKGNLYEGGIRMPSFVRGPGITNGTYCDVPVVQWDFLQTFYDLAGGTEPLPADLDGGSLRDIFENGNNGNVRRNRETLVFHFPWHTGEPESVIRRGNYKLRKNLDTLEVQLFDVRKDISEIQDLSQSMPELVQELDRLRSNYLESVNAETVTLTRRNYVELLEGGWIENGRKRLAKLKAELAMDPDNKQMAFKVDVSQNHVDFQDRQLKRSLKLIQMHQKRGTADQN